MMFGTRRHESSFNDRDIRAFLETGCELEGRLNFTGVVRLNGKIKGEIFSDDTLIVGEDAEIEGKINVGALILSGKIRGEVNARFRTEILETGDLKGILTTHLLITHEGAKLEGQVVVRGNQESKGTGETLKTPDNAQITNPAVKGNSSASTNLST